MSKDTQLLNGELRFKSWKRAMVTLLYPQMSEIGTVGVAGRERMMEIDIKKKLVSAGLWSYMNNALLLDTRHTPLVLPWEGEGSKGTFLAVDDSS